MPEFRRFAAFEVEREPEELIDGDVTEAREAIAGRYLGGDAGRRFAATCRSSRGVPKRSLFLAGLIVPRLCRMGCVSSFAVGLSSLTLGEVTLVLGESFCPLGGWNPVRIPHLDGVGVLKVGCSFVQIGGLVVCLCCPLVVLPTARRATAFSRIHHAFPVLFRRRCSPAKDAALSGRDLQQAAAER